MRQTEVTRWEEAHHTYRRHLETLSFTLHPFRMADAAPQTSAQVASHLLTTVAAIEVFAQGHQLPIRHAAITKVRKQIPALAALVDFWWERVRQDMAHADISPLWRQWAEEVLLPLVYWELCTPRCGWPTGRNWGHAEVVAILSPAVGCMRPVSLWCFVPVLWEFGPGSRAALSLVTGCVPIQWGRWLQA